MLRRLAPLGLAVLAAVLSATPTSAQAPAATPGSEFKHQFQPPPHNLDRAAFELWIPASVGKDSPIAAVILNPLYQADTKVYEMEDWRALAGKHRVAMMRHDMRTTVEGRAARLPVGMDAIHAIDDALAQFAKTTGHPELVKAPLVITGLSQGGGQTVRLASLVPDRAVAALPFHGSSLGTFPADHPLLQVPTLIILGSHDSLTPNTLFDLPWAMRHKPVWTLFLQPSTPHQTLGEQEFILMWLDYMLANRLPAPGVRAPAGQPVKLNPLKYDTGWVGTYRANYHLAATSAQVRKASEAGADFRAASWMPTEELAKAWINAMRTGIVSGHASREEIAADIAAAAKPVVVDGKLDDWAGLPRKITPGAQNLPNGLNYSGPADCDAAFAMACDDQFVYLALEVKDDKVIAEGKPPWNQDGVEIRLDARPALERYCNSGGGEGSDFLLVAVGPGPGKDQCFLVNQTGLPAGTTAACVTTEKGYTIEVRIPQSYLDQAQGGKWTRFRLNICIDDPDAEGKSQLWWRPDWRTEMSWFGSGTVQRKDR